MKNLKSINPAKLTAYFSLLLFAFINPYLLQAFVKAIQIYMEQYS